MGLLRKRLALFRASEKALQQLENDRAEQSRLFAETQLQRQELDAAIRRHEQAEFARNEAARREEEHRRLEAQRVEKIERQRQTELQAQEHQRQIRLRRSNPESLRRLRGLIRQRYEKDINVWNRRNVLQADRDLVMTEGRKADLLLVEIKQIVECWNKADGWTDEEWKVAKRIKECLAHGDQRMWEEHPPWAA